MASDSILSLESGVGNRFGNVGTRKCYWCRKFEHTCDFSVQTEHCNFCQENNFDCGQKLIVRAASRDHCRTTVKADASTALDIPIATPNRVSTIKRILRTLSKREKPSSGIFWEGREVSFGEIEGRYDINWKCPLGRGTYGQVFEAVAKQSSKMFAVKVINDSPDAKSELLAIRSISRDRPSNDHVIAVYDFWLQVNEKQHFSRTFIQMERCQGTLEEYLAEIRDAGDNIEPLELADIMSHILSGLAHCHKNGVCHRDLKLSNILYSDKLCKCHSYGQGNRWLLTDFGFSTIFGPKTTAFSRTRRGTAAYRAPELAEYSYDACGHPQAGIVSLKSDIWAIGCILFKLATTNKAAAFVNDYEVVAYKKHGHSLPQLFETHNPTLQRETLSPECSSRLPFWKQINSLLERCLARDPDERITAMQLKTWFEEVIKSMSDEEPSKLNRAKLESIDKTQIVAAQVEVMN